MGATEGREN